MFSALKSQPATTEPAAARGRQRKSSAWRKLMPYALATALLGAIVYGFLPKPIAVEIAPVGTAPLTVSVLEEGKTRIRHRYTISPPVAGQTKKWLVSYPKKILILLVISFFFTMLWSAHFTKHPYYH